MNKIGTIIDNKYEIKQYINKGGMSVVYLAVNTRLGNRWAIKEIKKTYDAQSRLYINSLIAEANLMKDIDYPTFPRIIDIIETHDALYLVMDYIEGKTLEQVIKENGSCDEQTVACWAQELCAAMSFLHRRQPPIIYRDMKPSNIILKSDGSLKIIDFGTARVYSTQKLADTVALGTRGFAPPEQYVGQTDARSDIYALGMTMMYLVTGINPCYCDYPVLESEEAHNKMSAAMRAVIKKCTALDPEKRYQSCEELLNDLRRLRFKKKKSENTGALPIKIMIPVAVGVIAAVILGITLVLQSIGAYKSSSHAPDNPPQSTSASSKSGKASSSAEKEKSAVVPDVVGKKRSDAEDIMKKAGFNVTVKTVYSDKVKEGYVISQSVDSGKTVSLSAVIMLTVSKGKKPESKAESSHTSKSSGQNSDNDSGRSQSDNGSQNDWYSQSDGEESDDSDSSGAESSESSESSGAESSGTENSGGEDLGGGAGGGGEASDAGGEAPEGAMAQIEPLLLKYNRI